LFESPAEDFLHTDTNSMDGQTMTCITLFECKVMVPVYVVYPSS